MTIEKAGKGALWCDKRQQKEELKEDQCDWCTQNKRNMKGLDLVIPLPEYS